MTNATPEDMVKARANAKWIAYLDEDENIIAMERPKSDWISVKEQLPPEYDMEQKPGDRGYIITDGAKVWVTFQHPCYWNTKDLVFNSHERCTHWMPLPKPPEDADENNG